MTDPKAKELQVRAAINQRFVETGFKEKLKEDLRAKLVESGWRDEMKNYCREVARLKGVENITVEELIEEITPKARSQVPEAVRQDLLQRIKHFLTLYAQNPSK